MSKTTCIRTHVDRRVSANAQVAKEGQDKYREHQEPCAGRSAHASTNPPSLKCSLLSAPPAVAASEAIGVGAAAKWRRGEASKDDRGEINRRGERSSIVQQRGSRKESSCASRPRGRREGGAPSGTQLRTKLTVTKPPRGYRPSAP